MTDINIYEGNDKAFILTITDADGVAVDITGYTILFTVKSSIDDTDTEALISKEITSHTTPASGITRITIDRADTLNVSPGKYPYDIQAIDISDDRTTVAIGTFQIIQSVTDREVS